MVSPEKSRFNPDATVKKPMMFARIEMMKNKRDESEYLR
jgi:hypothetical protein